MKKNNFENMLKYLNFTEKNKIYTKKFSEFDCELKADFNNEKLIYPDGLIVNDKTTSNFSSPENFVVFECVYRLLNQGYNPKHIELEKKWQLGHSQKSGKADIYIKDNDDNSLLIIECKTAGSEYKKAIDILESDSRNQLFSYLQQATSTKFLALYSSDFIDDRVVSNYYLINVTDNQTLLENNPKLKSYKEATTTEEKYQVWCDTYGKEYSTKGIFENSKAYEIGKTKFSLNDLKSINSKDIQGKYHEFATILRAHTVDKKENAFDKLVNLFLCKVVDEKSNPNELKFYWRGKAYDDPFDFQDRLQQLYKEGMKEFLDEDITYIDNSQIDSYFKVFDLKELKQNIKEAFKSQKFFTNNDFAFIEVNNEKLFYQNFEVLLKVSKMIQDIKLTESDENQFLGDMFEGFLDQGVKQSEGQFFTPMPIVKFIINSLPPKDEPKVIDYACGVGHFLNEYAKVNKNSKIVGIEKSYRLSKVAKVSSFMYGSEIEIIHDDALKQNSKVQNGTFDILIANPPYSVKGFLDTLDDENRQKYELIESIEAKSYSKNSSIECFFIERAKQLLKKDGIGAIIVPSSILNKDTPKIYTQTREIILQYFEVVAISEFGSGTFGKTGTNTVTLFLKRRCDKENLAGNYKDLTNSIFDNHRDLSKAFKDKDLLEKYCSYIEVDFEVYKTLFSDTLDNSLFGIEIFKEYREKFETLTETKSRKKRKYYKELSKEQKEEIEKKELIKFIKEIERDKFYYFCLACKNSSDVVVVKAPSNNSEIKKFLGYEWSSAKGNEGIKYLASVDIKVDDDLDEDDKRVLENIQGLESINTPLYNSKDSDDESKINKIIKDNFLGVKIEIKEGLKPFVNRFKLVDMLDFSRVDFNKALNLSVDKKVEIESKWDLVKLGEITEIKKGRSITQKNTKKGNIKVVAGGLDFAYYHNQSNRAKNIITISASGANAGFANFWQEEIFASDCTTIYNDNLNFLIYIFNVLKINQNKIFDLARGSAQPPVYPEDISKLKIPLPPLDIQEQIVKECQSVDDEVEKANEIIKEAKEKIEKYFQELLNQSNESFRLSNEDIFDVFIGRRVLSKEISQNRDDGIPVYSANVFDEFGYTKKVFLNDFSLDSVLWGIDGDWMVNFISKDKPFYPTDHCGIIRIKKDVIHPKYLTFALEQIGKEQRFSRHYRASTDRVKALTIKTPPIETQKQIISKIEKLETKINEAKKIIDSSKARKEEILKKYL